MGDGFCYFLQVEEEVLVVKTQNNKFQEVFYMFLFIKKIVGNIHYFTVIVTFKLGIYSARCPIAKSYN